MRVIQSKPDRAALCIMAGLVGLSACLGEAAPAGDTAAVAGSRTEQGVSSMSAVEAWVSQGEGDPGAVTTAELGRDVLVGAVLRALDAGHVPFGGPILRP